MKITKNYFSSFLLFLNTIWFSSRSNNDFSVCTVGGFPSRWSFTARNDFGYEIARFFEKKEITRNDTRKCTWNASRLLNWRRSLKVRLGRSTLNAGNESQWVELCKHSPNERRCDRIETSFPSTNIQTFRQRSLFRRVHLTSYCRIVSRKHRVTTHSKLNFEITKSKLRPNKILCSRSYPLSFQ